MQFLKFIFKVKLDAELSLISTDPSKYKANLGAKFGVNLPVCNYRPKQTLHKEILGPPTSFVKMFLLVFNNDFSLQQLWAG